MGRASGIWRDDAVLWQRGEWNVLRGSSSRGVKGRGVRNPDFIIGPHDDPYLRRWWVVPRNPWLNVYLHEIRRPDDDRALHDHPWWNVSFIVRGGYTEHTIKGAAWRGPGSITIRRPEYAHRLIPTSREKPSWSIFITGPRLREWGFYCPKGWVRWDRFVDPSDKGLVGPGCGE